MPEKIVVYTTSWCGDCRRLKSQLQEHQIPFEERDIEQSESDYKTMMGFTNGKRVIPTVDLGGRILINPSFAALNAALHPPD